jgi:hypothetical protein
VVDVGFEVGGRVFVVPEQQATILAENLRILAKSPVEGDSQTAKLLEGDEDWRPGAEAFADSIESALVDPDTGPLPLEGLSAHATHCVLRLMVGLDGVGADGLRNALGAPVSSSVDPAAGAKAPAPEEAQRPRHPRRLPHRGLDPTRHLSRPELIELFAILFVLAVLTVVAGTAWTGTWYLLAPVIAALLGLRVATTRAAGGRFAWSFASVVWWGVLLVPAAVLVTLVAFLVVSVLH